MPYSQSPPLAEKKLTAEETSSGRPVRDQDARSEPRFGRQPVNASIHSLHPARDRPSIGRRTFRSLTRFSIAVLIGVGATLGWQSYGDAASEMLAARAPTLAWLLSISATKSPVAVTSANPALRLEPLASNLDVVRRGVEQLAAKQEQVAQNIAALQAVEEDIRQKMSLASPSPASVQLAAPIPQHKPSQPRAVQSSSVPRPSPPDGPISLSR